MSRIIRRPGLTSALPCLATLLLTAASCLLSLPQALLADSGQGQPSGKTQPISDAEHRAAELVLKFFQNGPEVWWPHLADEAPLRELGKSRASAEISVRLGPSDGAEWILLTPSPDQPSELALFSVHHNSGLDDLIELEMVEQQGDWRILNLRSLADPRSLEGTISDLLASTPTPQTERVPNGFQQETASPWVTRQSIAWISAVGGWAAVPLISLLLLLTISSASLETRRRRRKTSVASVVAFALIFTACDRIDLGKILDLTENATPAASGDFESLADLLPLRLALSSSQTIDDQKLGTLVQRLDLQGPALEVASSWLAQRLIMLGRLKEAREILKAQPSPSALPITELLRARLAWLQSRRTPLC